MAEFVWPDWLPTAPELPPPPVDPHRIEGFTNRFIAASQDALHTAPDGLFGKSGADAIEAAPVVAAQLSDLRDATLELARDEPERQALADRLERYHHVSLDDIDRHVAEQRQVLARQTIAERQALNLRAAGLRHNQDTLHGLAEANASAAQALAQLEGMPEEPAMQAARSAVWRSAIDQRLADGEGARALALFERAKEHLVPGDQRVLEVPIQAAKTGAAADAWITREQAKPGDPLMVRVQADQDLSPAEKATTLAKIEAQDSARQSARIATVKGLDDKLEAAAHSLATAPGTYKPGTLAALANAHEDAGETTKAQAIRRLALQEGFLLSFARSSVAAQQRLIDGLPEGEDRAAAEAIKERQVEAFEKDAFSAGTALYPDVGPAKPIDDLPGRIAQARAIAAYRGIPVVPFTADQVATMRQRLTEGTPQEQQAVRTVADALPDDMKPALDGPSPSQPSTYAIDVEASMKAAQELSGQGDDENATDAGQQGAVHASEPPPDSPEYRAADAEARQIDAPSWEDLGFFQQVGIAFEQFDQEGKQRGATLSVDSAARHWQQVQELQRRQDAGETLNVVEKQYLLRNRRATSDLAKAVGRLVDAQRSIDRLPKSAALRQLFGASSAAEAARVLRERPGEVAQALGVESLPALTLSLVSLAVLGPVGGGLVLTGSSGLEGYANGLVGALTKSGVDISRPDELLRALQDKELMDRVRGEATTDAAIEAGITAAAMVIGGRRPKRPAEPGGLTLRQQAVENFAKGRKWEAERTAFYEKMGYKPAAQITVRLPSGRKIRLDLVFRDPETNEVIIIELKASKNPRLRRPQREKYEELAKFGGVVVGEGKEEFRGGTRIPPTKYKLETPYNTKQP
jgi:hypothetical protein